MTLRELADSLVVPVSRMVAFVVTVEFFVFLTALFPIPVLALAASALWRPLNPVAPWVAWLQRACIAVVGLFHLIAVLDHPDMSTVWEFGYMLLAFVIGWACLLLAIRIPPSRKSSLA